jgi:TolB-like protein
MSIVRELKRRNVIKVAIAYGVVAWLLIEVSATTFPMLRLPEWTATFVTVLLMMGFPVALILAWAFEITPEGIKREKDVDRSQSITHITGRNIDYIIIAALILALGFFTFDKFVLDPSRDAELVQSTTKAVTEQAAENVNKEAADKSIAVLPFVNLSSDPEQEYFSDGISEEILNVLAHIPELQVTSRSSAFSFKGKGLDIPTVAKQLGVANILEGSVRKSGKRIRITAQLIDARTDKHLWSETYDRELDDIFAVQDEISAAIVTALKENLGLKVEEAPRVTTAANTEAHDAYLRGRHLVVQRTEASVEGAVREFKEAVAIDPEYALAHAELAIAYLLQRRGQKGSLTESEAIAKAAPHADRAMTLDPTLAEAHAATGFVLRIQGNPEEALIHYRQAVQINPNYSLVYTWMGTLLNNNLGRYKEVIELNATAVRLDPLSRPATWNYILELIATNQLAMAERQIEKLASIDPLVYAIARGLLTSLGGNWANAVLVNLGTLRVAPGYLRAYDRLSWLFAAIGLEKEALAISKRPLPVVQTWLGRPGDALTTAEARLAEDPISHYARRDMGLALAGAGDYDRARPYLEEAWQRSGQLVTEVKFWVHNATALIAIRRYADEEAGIGELVAAINDNVRRYREAGIIRVNPYYLVPGVEYEEGLVAYLSGDLEEGLALIGNAVDDGFFIPPREAYLQFLYDDPGFAPIRAKQEERQIRERQKFLAIVCNDNPYEAVWQPAEGTCEQFAAAGGN